MRILLSMGLLLVVVAAFWMARPIWVPVGDTELLRHIRQVTAADDDRFHQIDLKLLYDSDSVPVGDLIEDLRRAGFDTDWVTNPIPEVRYLKRRCGQYFVQKDEDDPVVVRREWSVLEEGRGFMVSAKVDGGCVVTGAEVAWMRPNTL